ncbi:MAG: chromosomal replication initiator protein DnaA [Candidatus Babeliales bacterium]
MLKTIWDQFLTIVREEAGSRVVETWLKAVTLHKWNALDKVVYMLAPNSFVKNWIQSNYLNLFTVHLSRLLHVNDLKIVFIDATAQRQIEDGAIKIIPAQRINVPTKVTEKSTALTKSKDLRSRHFLNKNYLFKTFVTGPNNHMAYAAAVAITQKLGKLYNPLFIYGGSGLGKTHLLHAIANEIKEKHEKVEILYQPADRFVSEFINAIRFDKIHRFQAKYKNIDVFLVDDIQSISNKEQTQEAFFHIFNAMYDAHKQIVFSSDSYPTNIDGLAERLRSRLEWGLVTDVQIPTFETKIAIVKRKADLNNYEIPDDVATYIASRSASNVRELEGALIRVVAYASIIKQQISLEIAKKALYIEKESRGEINFDCIVKKVTTQYSYTISELRSKNRSKQLSWARQVAMYLMKKHTSKSLNEIALHLNRQDHSTVIHAFKQVEHRIKEEQLLSDQIQKIEQELQL